MSSANITQVLKALKAKKAGTPATPSATNNNSSSVFTESSLLSERQKVELAEHEDELNNHPSNANANANANTNDNGRNGKKQRKVPGFHPVNEWQLSRMATEDDLANETSLVPTLRSQGLVTTELRTLFKTNDVAHLPETDPVDSDATLFRFDPDGGYNAAQHFIDKHKFLSTMIKPLPPTLMKVMKRQKDEQLFDRTMLDDKIVEEKWARDVPPRLVAKLRPFQKKGVEAAWFHRSRFMIADEMGLGKTIQAITILYSSKKIEDWPALVTCPPTVRSNWAAECEKWSPDAQPTDVLILLDTQSCLRVLPRLLAKMNAERSGTSATLVSSSSSSSSSSIVPIETAPTTATAITTKKRKRAPSKPKRKTLKQIQLEKEEAFLTGSLVGKIMVISYHLLILVPVLTAMKACKIASLVCDESHALKHLSAKRTQACLELSTAARRIVLLTGTPTYKPSELYPQIKMIHPWMFPSWWIPYPSEIKTQDKARQYRPKTFSYASRYCDPSPKDIRQGGRNMTVWQTEKNAARLVECGCIFQHYSMISRRKVDVEKELPPLNRFQYVLTADPKDLEELRDHDEKMKAMDDGSDVKRTAANNMYDNILPRIKCPLMEEYFKHEFTEGELAQDPSIKILIFAHHHYTLKKLDECLTALNVPHLFMYGPTPDDERTAGIKKFQTTPASVCRVALLGITAFNSGINLYAASRVYMAECTWDPAQMLQAECRAHRLDSKRSVDVIYLSVKGSLDDVMWAKLEQKIAQSTVLTDVNITEDPTRLTNCLPSRYKVLPPSSSSSSSDAASS